MTRPSLALLLIAILISCGRIMKENKNKNTLKLTIEIVPEGDSLYSMSWSDTLGQSKNYQTADRPMELWCVLKSGDDTVGRYTGLSTPGTFTYFTSGDSIVQVAFMIGPNAFSPHLTSDMLMKYEGPIRFKPIDINVRRDLRRELEFVLTEE